MELSEHQQTIKKHNEQIDILERKLLIIYRLYTQQKARRTAVMCRDDLNNRHTKGRGRYRKQDRISYLMHRHLEKQYRAEENLINFRVTNSYNSISLNFNFVDYILVDYIQRYIGNRLKINIKYDYRSNINITLDIDEPGPQHCNSESIRKRNSILRSIANDFVNPGHIAADVIKRVKRFAQINDNLNNIENLIKDYKSQIENLKACINVEEHLDKIVLDTVVAQKTNLKNMHVIVKITDKTIWLDNGQDITKMLKRTLLRETVGKYPKLLLMSKSEYTAAVL